MALAGRLDIVVEQGATYDKTITIRNNIGNPIDLTDAVRVEGQIRRRPESDAVSANFSLSVIAPPTAGQIRWVLDAVSAQALEPIEQHYDLEVEFSDGTVTRLLEGRVDVRANTTR